MPKSPKPKEKPQAKPAKTAKTAEDPKNRRVSFSLEAPGALNVALTGCFSNWEPQPMKKNAQGVWTRMVSLAPGQHEYKFLVDGEWWNDPKSGEVKSNDFGTFNNVLIV